MSFRFGSVIIKMNAIELASQMGPDKQIENVSAAIADLDTLFAAVDRQAHAEMDHG